MKTPSWKHLDQNLRLPLSLLPFHQFEQFFSRFLCSGISLTVTRNGRALTKKVISAARYGGEGRKQHGIDLRIGVEGPETWAMQCKRVKKWTKGQTIEAINAAAGYTANHYFLAVACDTPAEVHEEIAKHPNWTLWNLDLICSEFCRLVPASRRKDILSFLSPEELRKFLPFHTESLISPQNFFCKFTGSDKPLRHDWPLVGREPELNQVRDWMVGDKKVLLLEAAGGEGKSRLLKEICEIIEREQPDTEVLVLNPYREESNFSFALAGSESKKIVLIDDAHRNHVPGLLELVMQDFRIKTVLSLRPQEDHLFSSTLDRNLIETVGLSKWTKQSARALAKEVFKTADPEQINSLVELTESNPFLITISGSFLKETKGWQALASTEFRQKVFEEFEMRNLQEVAESNRSSISQLLRLISIISPVEPDSQFYLKAEQLLKAPFIERLINFLKKIGLIVVSSEGLRIVPDLFADFLVYETCFDAEKKQPLWVENIIREFPDRSVSVLKNLAEANWIARLNGVVDEKLLRPLFEFQKEQFRKSSFIDRSEILRHWIRFAPYIPKETLELASLAIQETSAPVGLEPFKEIDYHGIVLRRIPHLIGPIAKYHPNYCYGTMDLLWHLALMATTEPHDKTDEAAIRAMAGVFEFSSNAIFESITTSLKWLKNRVKDKEDFIKVLRKGPFLRLLLGPCFSRFYDSLWSEGRTVFIRSHGVPIKETQVARDAALEILRWIIENSTSLEVLDALGAAETAIEQVGVGKIPEVKNLPELQKQWLPERLKALRLFRMALELHSDEVVRYQVYKSLSRSFAGWDDQPEFRSEVKSILEAITDDLPLRVVKALFQDFFGDFEKVDGARTDSKWYEKTRDLWWKAVERVANELVIKYPTALELHNFLDSIFRKLIECRYSPTAYPLFSNLRSINPSFSVELTRCILSRKHSCLGKYFIPLLPADSSCKNKLLKQAVKGNKPDIVAAVVGHLSFMAATPQILDEESQALLHEIAAFDTQTVTNQLLELIECASETNAAWSLELLADIGLSEITPPILERVLGALAPYQGRSAVLSNELIERFFNLLLDVPDLRFDEHQLAWERLRSLYPVHVFKLLYDRIWKADSKMAIKFVPVPCFSLTRWRFTELRNSEQSVAFIQDLWNRATNADTNLWWRWLFKAVVFDNDPSWENRLLTQLANASTLKQLEVLADLISYDHSLIIFNFPKITKSYLERAMEISGPEGVNRIQAALFRGSGPSSRIYTNGEREPGTDYLEANAIKAADEFAQDELLGSFYRWIVSCEQQSRKAEKLRAEGAMQDN